MEQPRLPPRVIRDCNSLPPPAPLVAQSGVCSAAIIVAFDY